MPADTTTFNKIIGPVLSSSAISTFGAVAHKYMTDFVTYSNQHWATYGSNWADTNYYDRAEVYYAWYAQTGNAEYLTRANAQALDYRVNYLEANNFTTSSHWSQMEGIELHYLATGDEKSRFAVGQVADLFT